MKKKKNDNELRELRSYAEICIAKSERNQIVVLLEVLSRLVMPINYAICFRSDKAQKFQ